MALTIAGDASSSEETLRRLVSSLSRLDNPAAVVILFAMGRLATRLPSIASGFAERVPDGALVLAATERGFTERGELTSKDGFVGLIHCGRPVRLTGYASAAAPFGSDEPSVVEAEAEGPSLVLLSGTPAEVARHGRIPTGANARGWFGAVTSEDGPIWMVQSRGKAECVPALRIAFPALETPLVVGASCCRTVSEPFTVTAVAGKTLLELDGLPALVALGKVTSRLAERSWIVLGLVSERETVPVVTSTRSLEASAVSSDDKEEGRVVYRPLRGVDPARGALILREGIKVGSKVAFAIRDERVARRAIEDGLRKVKQRLSGSIPRFGIYFEGLGRGPQLFGASNVELSLIRQSLGEFPLLGCRTSNELKEHEHGISICSMSGQLALFKTPS